MPYHKIPVLISGGGASGEFMAMALAARNIPCRILTPEMPESPVSQARTIAIWRGGLDYLAHIFQTQDFLDDGHPIRAMSLIDEKGQETCYLPEDIGLEEEYFGYNLNLETLTQRARANNRASGLVEHHHSRATQWLDAGTLRSEEGTVHQADLVIVAEGKDSATATQAGIAPLRHTSGCVAVIAVVRHEMRHDGFAREYHRKPGPLAFVPLDDHHSSIVWIHKSRASADKVVQDHRLFLQQLNSDSLEQQEVTALCEAPAIIPLASRQTLTLRAERLALIGESGHKMPPTGAQGLNLTLRDIAELEKLVSTAYDHGRDIGGAELLRNYSTQRMKDALATTGAVHLGNASIRFGEPLAWLRRALQHKIMPQFPKVQQSLIRHALYGF